MNQPLDIHFLDRLQNVYGNCIEMSDENGKRCVLTLVAEFEYHNRAYAVLLPLDDKGDVSPELFRIVQCDGAQWQLETIVDDDEWEEVMERYDEITYQDAF